MRRLSATSIQAIERNAPQLGAILSSYESDILDAIEKKYPGSFASFQMARKRAELAIAKAKFYYAKGYGRDRAKAKGLRDAIAKDMKATDAERIGILRLLVFLEEITPEKYPVLANYLIGKKAFTASNVTAAATVTAKNAAAATADHLKQVAKETISDAGKLVTSAVNAANEAAPWYLKPRNLLLAALAGAFVFYGLPLLRMLPKRPQYRQNPVSPRLAKRAKADEKYIEFHAKKPNRRFSVPQIDTDELTYLGDALEIGYKSGKWEKGSRKNNYLHQFGKGVKLCATPDGKALVIFGGKMNVQDRGIVN